MRNNWKKKALSALSLVLIISMIFSSGLSTLAAEAASSIERTIKTMVVEKAAQKLNPKAAASNGQSKLLKGLTTTKTPTLLTLEGEEKVAPQAEAKVEAKAATEDKGAAPEKGTEKKAEAEAVKEVPKAEAEKEVPKAEAEKEVPKAAAEKEVPKAEAEKEVPKAEAEKEVPKAEEKLAEEEGKPEAATGEDKKEEAPKAGEVAATKAEITIKPSLNASVKVETVVAEGESSGTIVTGDKVDKGTTIKVTVTPKKAGDWLHLHVGEEIKDIQVPGGATVAGAADKAGATEAKKGEEDTDKADTGATPVKKVEDKTEADKIGPTLTTVSAEADKAETPKATVKLGDSGGDLAPVSFEFIINKDTTIEIVKIAAAGAYGDPVASTTEIYGKIVDDGLREFELADGFTNNASYVPGYDPGGGGSWVPANDLYSWFNIVNKLNDLNATITLSTGGVAIVFDSASSGPKLGDTEFKNLVLDNFNIPDLKVNASEGLEITGGSKVGEVNQDSAMDPDNFKVGENVEIASLKAPYPTSIGDGSKIKLAGDKVSAGATLNGGAISVAPVSTGATATITVESTATWNVLNGEISDGADPPKFANITFEDGSTIGVVGASDSTPKNIVINADDKAITVGSTATGIVNINNYADRISTATPAKPPESVMGTVNFNTTSGAINILAQLERGKNGTPNATASGGIVTATATSTTAPAVSGNVVVGTSGDDNAAGSVDYLNISIGTGTVDIYGSANTITSTAPVPPVMLSGSITVNSKAGTVNKINAFKGSGKQHDVTITRIGDGLTIGSIHGGAVNLNMTSDNDRTKIGTVSAQNGLTINAPKTGIDSAFLNAKPANPTIKAKSIKDYYLGSDMVVCDLNGDTVSAIHLNLGATVITNIHMGGLGMATTGTKLKLTFGFDDSGTPKPSSILGDIYMGGNGTITDSNTSVDTEFVLDNDNTIGGSIYGGSVATSTTKSSTITLTSGTVKGNVYGGAKGAGTTGEAKITALNNSSTIILGTIYGGGDNGNVTDSTVKLETDVFEKTATFKDLIFGGSKTSGSVGSVAIELGSDSEPISFARPGNIYGGGEGTGGNANVTGDTKITFVGAGTADGTAPSTYDLNGSIFGGSKTNGTSGNIKITLQGVGVAGDVQGGSAAASATKSVDVTISPNGTDCSYIGGSVYGGGAGPAKGEIPASDPIRTTTVLLGASSAVAGDVFGGGNGGDVSDNGSLVHVMNGAKVGKDIYGGGNGASVTGGKVPATQVDYNGVAAGGDIYGGSLNGNITGGTEVNINTTIGVTGTPDAKRNVYGGNKIISIAGRVDGGTAVNITAAVVGSVYGGGVVTGGTSKITVGTVVNIKGVVSGPVYGGGYGNTNNISDDAFCDITGGTVVNIDAEILGPVYGGSHNEQTGIMSVDKTEVNVNAKVAKSVFGGGHATNASGTSIVNTTEVNIKGAVGEPIYGGGEANAGGSVVKVETVVNVSEETKVNVYGGGLASSTSATAQVEGSTDVQIKAAVGTATTPANVYGGGHSVSGGKTSVDDTAKVTLTDDKTVTGFIYGGGHGGKDGVSATAANTLVTLGSDTSTPVSTKVTQSVYGGGHGENAPAHVTGKTHVKGGKATVGVNIYGGGHAQGADANVNTLAKVDLKEVKLANVSGNDGFVYGGGHGAGTALGVKSQTGETAVTIDDMIAPKSVYGGGHGATSSAPVMVIGTGSGATGTGKTSVTIGNGLIIGTIDTKVTDSVYGGGRAVKGNATAFQTNVVINKDATIDKTVYGGGHSTASPVAGTSANILSLADGSDPSTDPSATNVTVAGTVTVGVYGGGYATDNHTADVVGGTLVKVLNTADISKNVYGGGRDTKVGQTAKVDIEGETEVKTTIFGGGHGEARVAETQKTKITANGGSDGTSGGKVEAVNVYGGGYANKFSAPVHEGTVIEAKDLTTKESVYGGGFASASPNTGTADATVGAKRTGTSLKNSTKITLSGGSDIGESVYGGGHAVAGNATVGDGSITNPATKIELLGNTIVRKDVYGGGRNMNATINANIKGSTDILLNGDKVIVTKNVYGGGHAALGFAHIEAFTKVTVDGNAKVKNVFGGGYADKAEAHIKNAIAGATQTVATLVTIQGNAEITESVYGGGYSPDTGVVGKAANIAKGGTKVTVTGAGTAKVGENVYGGGHSDVADAKVAGDTTVTISKTNDKVAVDGTVYGGGRSVNTNAEIAGNTTVTVTGKSVISGGVFGGVFGGGHGEKGLAKVLGDTNVEIAMASVIEKDVYGGGQGLSGLADIKAGTNGVGTANVTMTGTARVKGSVYGGGCAENATATIASITNVKIDGVAYADGGAIVDTNVYGGGHGLNSNADILGRRTNVSINNGKVGGTGGNVYGGGRVDTTSGTAKVHGDTKVTVTQSLITKDVYGGGIVTIAPPALPAIANSAFAEVAKTTSVTLGKEGVPKTGKYQVDGNVYGGGHNANVNKKTNVFVYQGTVNNDVFGGGHGFAQINLPTTNQATLKEAVTNVIIDNNGLNNPEEYSVKKSVYGGGRSGDADINGSTSVVIQPLAKIDLDLYGGGRGSELGFDMSDDDEPDTSIGYEASKSKSNIIHGGTNVNIKGWIGQDAYAGGQHQSHVMGDDGTYIKLDNLGYVHRDLHGGGRNSNVLKDTETIVASGGTGNRDVYGGTANHKGAAPAGIQDHHIGEHTLVKISLNGTVKRDVYGAGDFSETKGAKGTTVDISGHVYRDVYGGGNRFALVLGVKGTKVDINSTGLVGETLSYPDDPKDPRNYPSFDFDDELKTVYDWPFAGHVYGGGSVNSHVAMSTPTAGQGEGTDVHIHAGATVRGVVFGGGKGSNVVAHDPVEGNANVLIEGYVGRVHGGGRVEDYKGTQLEAKTSDTTNGTVLHVTGPSAIVFTDAYGGGFGGFKGNRNLVDGALNLKADVLIDQGSNVRFRVFGGGNQFGATTKETTNVVFTGDTTVIGHAKELFAQTRDNTFISGWLSNISYKADNREKYGTDYFDRWMFYRDPEFTSLGSIYGGGNGTSVGVSTNIDIGDNTQIALNFVSGGNIGVKSLNTAGAEIPRTIQIGSMGAGDLVENSYTNTNQYGLIRVLGDYTAANAKDSYLTIYYHLDGVDGGNTTAKTLIMDDAYQTSGTNYNSELVVDTGIYHPWRPEPHTVVRVEPSIQMLNGSKFRMQYGYTIKLQNGIFPESPRGEHLISLLMDVPLNPASTSKIYAPKDNVIQGKPFHFRELPFTIELSRLQDVSNEDERGLRIYFPSNNVDDTGGKNTNSGGKDSTDKGTGNSGGWGGGWSSGAVTSGVAVAPGKVVGTGAVGYLTAESKVVSQDEVLKNLQTALANSKTNTVTINERLAGQVSGTTLLAMAQNAAKAGKTAIYQGDTVRGNRIEGRMSIDTSKASGVTGTLKTGVYTAVQMTKEVGTMFAKFFQNRLSVVRLAQEGSLGVEAKIAAYVNLQGMNLNTLHFYAYSAQNNKFQRMPNPRYSVDKNGYLHFYTNVGGHVIITDKPLVRK